ncbi:MAG: CoA transferase [Chloroflexi bacterium]|nr:CoA transferase [Chloroflexota bacterium]
MTTGILRRCRVLDLADEKGAYCSRLLAEMGADVIKVEPPGGDPARQKGPFLDQLPDTEESLYFQYVNAGKRGITLAMHREPDASMFRRLAAGADVIVESFEPGYLDRFDLGYKHLSALNPGLIVASITGFGLTGPYRLFVSSDIVASGMGGQMYITGREDTPPLSLCGDQSYYIASMFAAIGILQALRARRAGGKGQHIDISLQECVAATLDHVLPRYFSHGEVSRRQGSLHWSGGFCVFPCLDGYALLSLFMNWDTLVEWLDSEGMADDLLQRRWQDPEQRRRGTDHIIEVLERWSLSHQAAYLEEQGQLMGFPWARVAGVDDVAASPQLRSRGFFIRTRHPGTGRVYESPGVPARLSLTPFGLGRPAPRLGEHNAQVLGDAGSGETEDQMNNVPARMARTTAGPPLAGVRVLDFTRVLAGPYATRLMADFGAEVIKVQRPSGNEQDPLGGAYYGAWNRNKRSIALDMSRPEGLALARRLIGASDILVENFSPRVMANWGLDYPHVRELRPDIIMVSISAMGQTGPLRDFTGFAPTLHALSGMTHLTSFPGKPPLGPGYSYADHVAGLTAALATLAALEHRSLTGEGQFVDVSVLESMCALMGPALLDWTVNRHKTAPHGNGSPDAAPHGCYRCAGEDAWCVLAVETEEQWRSFAAALEHPEWVGDARFSSKASRLQNAAELDRLVEKWTSRLTPDRAMIELQKAGIPAGKVQDARQIAADPQLNARRFFTEPEPASSGLKCDGSPIRILGVPPPCRTAPAPGQDTDDVLTDILGLDKREVMLLKQEGVIS